MTDDELTDELTKVISDTFERYWQPTWAARAILPFIRAAEARGDAWKTAIQDELSCLHLYSAEHDTDPRKALHDIIMGNQQLALEPAISKEARDLEQRGFERAKGEQQRCPSCGCKFSYVYDVDAHLSNLKDTGHAPEL